ncbi:MAG TPA: hypothetical protein VGR56_06450 [Nitrososphaerales archaeon]|nr:hypothetical protein [Nitrososphaerales archaeon]
MLTSKVVQENINSLLDSLSRSELDEAKRKLAALSSEVKSEKDRGSLLAAAGIYASMTKGKEGTMQTWEPDKVERAAKSITLSQMADEFDSGYAETLVNYSRLRQNNQQPSTYTEVSK